VLTDKKAAQKKLELMKKKVKKEKVNARKSREKLNLEIDKLKDELKVPAQPLLTIGNGHSEILPVACRVACRVCRVCRVPQSEMMTRITVLTEKQEIEMKQAELQTVVGSLEKELSEERFARAQDERTIFLHAPISFLQDFYTSFFVFVFHSSIDASLFALRSSFRLTAADELNAMKTMKEKLETELAEVTQKYTSGTTPLDSSLRLRDPSASGD
jgi:hypothetical protein